MKIGWIRAAEGRFAESPRGALGGLLGVVDGSRDWHPVSTAPFNRDLEIRILDQDGLRVAPFPCRQTADGWINADLGVRMRLCPVAWRPWPSGA